LKEFLDAVSVHTPQTTFRIARLRMPAESVKSLLDAFPTILTIDPATNRYGFNLSTLRFLYRLAKGVTLNP